MKSINLIFILAILLSTCILSCDGETPVSTTNPDDGTIDGNPIDGYPATIENSNTSIAIPADIALTRSIVTITVPDDYPTIQKAIEQAGYGDTIRVRPGTYTENLVLKSGIKLIGSGALVTFLDAQNQAMNLIDYTNAQSAVVMGFTLKGVARADIGCANPDDVFLCSGNWYRAALYGDGHTWTENNATPIIVANNIFEDNFIAVMGYFHAQAIIRNNIFINNSTAIIFNSFQDKALVMNNVFWNNDALAIGSDGGYIDIINNIIAGSYEGIRHEYVQTGSIRNNVFFNNVINGGRVQINEQGNIVMDPMFLDPGNKNFLSPPDSGVRDKGLNSDVFDIDQSLQDPGAFGGTFGSWPIM